MILGRSGCGKTTLLRILAGLEGLDRGEILFEKQEKLGVVFHDLYFKMRYKDEVNRVIREDGKIISALQMIPYPMTFCDEVISGPVR